jgi:hypothetical protein
MSMPNPPARKAVKKDVAVWLLAVTMMADLILLEAGWPRTYRPLARGVLRNGISDFSDHDVDVRDIPTMLQIHSDNGVGGSIITAHAV